jgi:uncharacterized membrane protein
VLLTTVKFAGAILVLGFVLLLWALGRPRTSQQSMEAAMPTVFGSVLLAVGALLLVVCLLTATFGGGWS